MEKYYTPDISEFHVGFEYHYKDLNHNLVDYGWFPETVKEDDGFNIEFYKRQISSGDYKAKYLDREDIESLDWTESQITSNNTMIFFRDVKNFLGRGETVVVKLMYAPLTSHVMIYLSEPGGNTLFTGKIKNKSELKKLMQQLNIL